MAKQNCLLLILAAILDFGIKKMYEDFIWKNLPTITFIFSFIQVGHKGWIHTSYTFENRNILNNPFGDFNKRVSGSVHTLNFSFLPLKVCFV